MRNFRFFTDRLEILDMKLCDCDYAVSECGDKIAGKYMCDPYYKSGDELREILKDELKNSKNWTDDFYFSVFEKDSFEIVGTACVFLIKKDSSLWGIGYSIKREKWNVGYGTELIKGLCNFVKLNNGKIISSLVAKQNIGSLKICFKNGFKIYKETEFTKLGTNIKYSAYELRKNL